MHTHTHTLNDIRIKQDISSSILSFVADIRIGVLAVVQAVVDTAENLVLPATAAIAAAIEVARIAEELSSRVRRGEPCWPKALSLLLLDHNYYYYS